MEAVQPTVNDALLKSIEELKTYEKKNLRINRIKLICAFIAAALCVVIAIVLIGSAGRITENIDSISTTMTEAGNNINLVAEDLQKIDFELLGNSVQSFADTGTETINQIKEATTGLDTILDEAEGAIQNISSINIDQLNQSIKELHDVLEPLANFFNIFH